MVQHDNIEEMIDLLDDNGLVIVPMPRSHIMESDSPNFRLVCAFVRNHQGQFVMFRRAYNKKCFPGLFGTVGGCVSTGETYVVAFAREVYEEIGIDVRNYSWKFLGYTTPKKDNTIGHVGVYEIRCNDAIQYNQNDFAECRVFSLHELATICAENKEVTHNLPILLKKFYAQ